ncbi:hypothetical protein EJ05DRAFT_491055 [Pseudovirgaria hyperparasitica]|uniref:magnesium chelatase n=1 Tax=Pseudovirgaria hyperparasitica TaxID=470096 RepID=A0A6A6WKI6_9PEZI|nr:uncharacterized protein EJ05DRAFT_491055 [Pseudovirgaria hyperparasitica]KAF2762705.1 hypothetical protein EJ05DRAFT_491055 [Pseudovirgaria hyperparasitica]
MDIPGELLLSKVQALSDLELACLLCLIADQHFIVEASATALNHVEQELKLISTGIFGLSCSTLECHKQTTVDDFGNGLLETESSDSYFTASKESTRLDLHLSANKARSPGRRSVRSPMSPPESRQIANLVILKNLDQAPHQVQVQTLELIRGRRIFTRTTVHVAPKPFLLIALLPEDHIGSMNRHLIDHFFISHRHGPADELPNLEELGERSPTLSSMSTKKIEPKQSVFSREDLETLSQLESSVRMSSDVRCYVHNIVVFLRMHRAVSSGITAAATRHVNVLSRALAPLHGLNYVTPSLVSLAARKIYTHRIVLTTPEGDRSIQWGSSIDAVRELLDGVTARDVIDEILETVEVPL